MNKLEYFHTLVAHDDFDSRHHGAVAVPVYNNSMFTFTNYKEFQKAYQDLEGPYVYSRVSNPTVEQLEKKLAMLEGGEKAKCFSSGNAAISAAVMSAVGSGDHIVCVNQVYGPARLFISEFLIRYGITSTFVNGTKSEEFEAAIQPNTKLLYLESPTSLVFELQDLREVRRIAERYGLVTIIDNSWASPCFQNPLQFGIDLVVHSLTKYVSGHSDTLGGAIIGTAERVDAIAKRESYLLGASLHPQAAAALLKGMRTLPLRMARHQQSTMMVAKYLESLPFVDIVHYPGLSAHPQHSLALTQMSGFGGLLSFEAPYDSEVLCNFAESLQLFRIGVSFGGFESLVTVQTSMRGAPSRKVTVVRLFIGLEDPDDLVEDLKQAFRKSGMSGE